MRNFVRCWLSLGLALVVMGDGRPARASYIRVEIPGVNGVRLNWEIAPGEVLVTATADQLSEAAKEFYKEGHATQGVAAGGANAFASNSSSYLRASASASAPAGTSTEATGWHTNHPWSYAYASNTQILMLDFANSSIMPHQLTEIVAHVSLHGSVHSPQQERVEKAETVVYPDGSTEKFVEWFDEVVSRVGAQLEFYLPNDSVTVQNQYSNGLNMRQFGGGGFGSSDETSVTLLEQPDIGSSSSKLLGVHGLIDLQITLKLEAQAVSEYVDPISGKLELLPYDGTYAVSERFAVYQWTQALTATATQGSYVVGHHGSNAYLHSGAGAVMDMANTLTFSHGTLLDGSSLASLGIQLYHVNTFLDNGTDPGVQPVPEPTSLGLAAIGGIGLIVMHRRRKKEKPTAA